LIIKDEYLTINKYTRSGRKLNELLGIILHWTGPYGHNAKQIWNYFEYNCTKDKHYSSAHYIIGFEGEIIHAIPNDEIAYHCGSSKNDPISKCIYTDWARKQFGIYANTEKYTEKQLDKIIKSPNQVTIGIELCAIDEEGNFNSDTIRSAINLVSNLLYKYNRDISIIGTHNKVVGWKDCPKI